MGMREDPRRASQARSIFWVECFRLRLHGYERQSLSSSRATVNDRAVSNSGEVMTDSEAIAELVEKWKNHDIRLRMIETAPKTSWFEPIKPYLPELRSLVWMAFGILSGGGATWYAKPAPDPVVKSVEREVVVNPGQVKAQMENK